VREHDHTASESEQLVHRFLDQELSGDERVQLLVRLGRDGALREQLIHLERLMLGVNQLPRPLVPDHFVASVMARTATEPSVWRRLIDAFWAPRALQWNLAGALAAAAIVLIAVGALVVRGFPPQPASTLAPVVATSSASATPVLVRLVVLQPGATTMEVAGDFNGWDPKRTPLEQTSTGAWAVTIALEPGRYEYMFVVDGTQWIADPFAVEKNDDGFGSQNAVLEVRPTIGEAL